MASGDQAVTGRRKPKGAKARPSVKMDDKAQSERFLEAAREAGVNGTGETFERAFDRIVISKTIRNYQEKHWSVCP